jgi:hypothetical protein
LVNLELTTMAPERLATADRQEKVTGGGQRRVAADLGVSARHAPVMMFQADSGTTDRLEIEMSDHAGAKTLSMQHQPET